MPSPADVLVAARGQYFQVIFAETASGDHPARSFLEGNHGARHKKSIAKVLVTIQRLADTQPGQFRDPQRFKPIGEGLYEFRDDQVRLICGFNGKGELLLLDGVIKKKDDLRPADIDRAGRIRADHMQKFGAK